MEHQYQKVVNVTYLAFAAIIAFLALLAMMKLSNTYDFESRVKSAEYIIRGLSIAVGALVFFGLYSNNTSNTFMNEVAVELLTKVTWPTGKDTVSATIIVIVTVVIAGLVLATFDWLFTMGLQWFWGTAQHLFS
ncbi:MAG: preprotein translocase subunit SecE [Deltaproteobacteria bacterium]|nr:preprotein translocase subunit SecE [Deltaproteobacteria bacterium]